MQQTILTAILQQYPEIIAQMKSTFTSHEFILEFAQRNQVLYVEALYDQRNTPHGSNSAPFKYVHSELSQRLHDFPDLVTNIGHVPSRDIFGHSNGCAQWKKV